MAEELETLWSKLTFTEEDGEDIELGSNSTKAAKEMGKNCVVMKILTPRIVFLDALRKNIKCSGNQQRDFKSLKLKMICF